MTPKEAAIEVERVLKDAGYMLGDLTFCEVVGCRLATYDFGDGNVITSQTVDGEVEPHNAAALTT